MSVFSISARGEVYRLSATTQMSVNFSGTLNQYRMQFDEDRADNYRKNNKIFTFSGKISDISAVYGGYKDTVTFLSEINQLFQDEVPLEVAYDPRLPTESNCYFTSFTYSADTISRSLNGPTLATYQVDFTLEQARPAVSAVVDILVDPRISDLIQAQRGTSGVTKEAIEVPTALEEAARQEALAEKAFLESVEDFREFINEDQ